MTGRACALLKFFLSFERANVCFTFVFSSRKQETVQTITLRRHRGSFQLRIGHYARLVVSATYSRTPQQSIRTIMSTCWPARRMYIYTRMYMYVHARLRSHAVGCEIIARIHSESLSRTYTRCIRERKVANESPANGI